MVNPVKWPIINSSTVGSLFAYKCSDPPFNVAVSPPLQKLFTIAHGENNDFLDNECFHSFTYHILASSLEKHQVHTSSNTSQNNEKQLVNYNLP
jgi:hypothetical protein